VRKTIIHCIINTKPDCHTGKVVSFIKGLCHGVVRNFLRCSELLSNPEEPQNKR